MAEAGDLRRWFGHDPETWRRTGIISPMSEIPISDAKTVVDAFDAAAGAYDASRRRLVPCFEDFYGTAVRFAVSRLSDAPRVLDLGAGTGLFSALVSNVRPDASFTLLDSSVAMLREAERVLGDRGIPYDVLRQDLTAPLPAGPYDAVISALAIHHLDDRGKADLYSRVASVLDPGGVFVNAEQVAGPTPAVDQLYDAMWERDARVLGSDERELTAARERMAFDRPATVAAQLDWLVRAGLQNVCSPYQNLRFAVLVGWAPECHADDAVN